MNVLKTESEPDTIFALASAHGRAGVAVLRVSGPRAAEALSALGVDRLPAPRVATLANFRHSQTDGIIDKGLALYFPAPNSFTGEDVAELHLHGSRAVVEEMLAALATIDGLRLAEPGEFSRRAYLSGKFDLTAAEGLGDLINAETDAQKSQALRLMEGHAGKVYDKIRARIIKALALLEAYLDFPDEDIPDATLKRVDVEIAALQSEISALLDDNHRGEKTRDGLVAVIIGAPNAGKSSLLNYLARRDVAIVSNIPGTTRDMIEVELNLGGYKLTLVDTAGLRESTDSIESEGVARARKRASTADLKLALFDAAALPALDAETLSLVDANTIAIASRWDLASASASSSSGDTQHRTGDLVKVDLDPRTSLRSTEDDSIFFLPLSTATGVGCAELIELLKTKVSSYFAGEPPLITHARHRAALENAAVHLARAAGETTSQMLSASTAFPSAVATSAALPSAAFLSPIPLELTCEDLRRAAVEIGKITGKIAVDEVLDVVFREFCIGK